MDTIIYIDGYNLFYGCLKHTSFKWLDLHKLFAEQIVRVQNPIANVTQIKFFTADIKAKIASQGQVAMQAQQSYHRALVKIYPSKIQLIKGFYVLERAKLPKFQIPPDKNERVDVWRLEEKETDVNIAITAYRDVVKNRAQQIIFVSNDSDLVPALRAIREDFGRQVTIGVVIPIREHGNHRPANAKLSEYANWTRRYITDEELSSSQLPDLIGTEKKPIKKPDYW